MCLLAKTIHNPKYGIITLGFREALYTVRTNILPIHVLKWVTIEGVWPESNTNIWPADKPSIQQHMYEYVLSYRTNRSPLLASDMFSTRHNVPLLDISQ